MNCAMTGRHEEIPATRHAEIRDRLTAIERSVNVRVLYARESGSRAWGFASPDSDWNVRFIYVHPLHAYLKPRPPRDTIAARGGGLDLEGWDLRKTAALAAMSNRSLIEWLNSPIVYRNGRSRTKNAPHERPNDEMLERIFIDAATAMPIDRPSSLA